MRFTRLRLNGFKSFVDPTDLLIDPGLTGVVGPNGCGKSNLLEALRWVMGESRPTAMRGGGMEDVIFAGTSRRPAKTFAEVALVIDNADRRAPAAFNTHDSLEITRRITREAGSTYRVQGRDVRARDVQVLFADASTGAQSPSLVRQGQISELISSKPTARRRVLEEAAGIAGLHQRRHEAELKLRGAEANLARVDDVIERLAGQVAQLERQARQARRYREIGERLRAAEALLLGRRWLDAEREARGAEAAMAQAAASAHAAETRARAATSARTTADALLPALREEDAIASALLQRLELERVGIEDRAKRAAETIAALERRRAQIDRDAERERTLNADADATIARLAEEEAALEAADAGHAEAFAKASAAAEAAAADLARCEAEHARATEDVARLAARHQSAAEAVEAARQTRDAALAEGARTQDEGKAAEAALAAACDALETANAAAKDAEGRADAAERALIAAEGTHENSREDEAAARADRTVRDGERAALLAERATIAALVAGDGAEDRALDRVTAAPGFEAALGAALGADLAAPIAETGSGWRTLPPYAAPPPLPGGAAPLSAHVEVPEALARRIGQAGLVEGAPDAALRAALVPGQALVSRAGDLWRWDGFVAMASDTPDAATLRLRQRNRLAALDAEIATLEEHVAAAREAHDLAAGRLKRVAEAHETCRAERRAADGARADALRAVAQSEAARARAESRRDAAALATGRLEEAAREAAGRLEAAAEALSALQPLAARRAQAEAVGRTAAEARSAALARRAARDDLERAGTARSRRRDALAKDLEAWRTRLATAGSRLTDLAARRARTEAELLRARSAPADLDAARVRIADDILGAGARQRRASDALRAAEAALRDTAETERSAERAAGEAREARAAATARAEAARGALADATARIGEALDLTPERLRDRLGAAAEDPPAAERVEAEIADLRRRRDALGAVNLRAEEDLTEIGAERGGLAHEKADLEAAIGELRRGIAALNREGRERLLAAFERVNANFARLFVHLFGGGEARLELVASDDPLDAGLEILCQPPGKRLSTLSLLSGGEQTLTAMALIFAVFLANPAPICVLDEVDAPLDDANVTRFCDLLDEMTRRTQTRFLIITHHAVTMARMDRLFGVTMAEQGVSQLVSVDLKRAEQMVA